jgi:hypothetical protein
LTSHIVTAVTSLSSDRLIVGDDADVIFDVNDEEVVVGGGLAAIAEGGEQRRYRGTLGEVRGRARMRNFSIPPRAIAENDGVKVGGGGGGLLWEGVETEPRVISSLYTPDTYIWYSKKRRE